MALFLSSVTNKVDKKGRVSVPAAFRAELKSDGYTSFYAFPSLNHRCLECWTLDKVQDVRKSLQTYGEYSQDREAFEQVLSDIVEFTVDVDGRIVLPEDLAAFAGITENVTFVGRGDKFHIWEPTAYQAFRAAQRDHARAARESFHLRPAEAVRGAP